MPSYLMYLSSRGFWRQWRQTRVWLPALPFPCLLALVVRSGCSETVERLATNPWVALAWVIAPLELWKIHTKTVGGFFGSNHLPTSLISLLPVAYIKHHYFAVWPPSAVLFLLHAAFDSPCHTANCYSYVFGWHDDTTEYGYSSVTRKFVD